MYFQCLTKWIMELFSDGTLTYNVGYSASLKPNLKIQHLFEAKSLDNEQLSVLPV